MWIAALVVAAALITWSTVILIAANPTTRLPWLRSAANEPGRATLLRLLAVVVGLIGGLMLAPSHSRIAFGIGVLVVMIPTLVLQARHNASIDK